MIPTSTVDKPTVPLVMKSFSPDSIAPPFARYAHGVVTSSAMSFVHTSGQLALHKDGSIPQGAQAQAELCFANIDAILTEAKPATKIIHIVKVNAFVTGREHMTGYMQARDAWLANVEELPASTLLIVSGFTRPEFVVEIEVVAALE